LAFGQRSQVEFDTLLQSEALLEALFVGASGAIVAAIAVLI